MFLNALITVNVYCLAIFCSFVAYVVIFAIIDGLKNVIKEFFNFVREWATYRYILYKAKKIHEREAKNGK